jgi:hypothetical protein
MITVEEYFEEEGLDKDDVSFVTELGDYWEKSGHFVDENWERHTEDLSVKQFIWLERIRNDMAEMRIMGKL